MLTDVETIAKSLTKAQRDCIAMIGDQVILASNVNGVVGTQLFDLGIISQIRAAGHYFTNLTEAGQQIRALLPESQS